MLLIIVGASFVGGGCC
ncbi:hypothetical protein [Peribacillus butanolivorans]